MAADFSSKYSRHDAKLHNRVTPEIVHEDSDVVVINKPPGLIVHSDGRTAEPTVADWAVATFPEMKGVGEPWESPQGEVIDRPGIVHRLDRTTSGVMILAKTKEAHALLKEQFQSRSTEKEYRAFVYGHPKEDAGLIEKEIVRIKSSPPRWGVAFKDDNKKRVAVTEWRVLKRGDAGGVPASYLSISPKTGRTHQIRVHMKAMNHSIVADHLYAGKQPSILGFTRPALHAHQLSITLPSGERKTFEAPLPADFEEALAQLQ